MYDKNNIFAKIIRGEVPISKVYEDFDILAFHDIGKAAPVHVLVIPKGEFINLPDFVAKAGAIKVENFFQKVAEVARMLDLESSGYRVISNIGSDASQSVPHFHVHILGKKKLGALVVGDRSH
ncbi:MAG: HIT domain-containing protein [Rickettsiales bacterium]|nr:HIT domain-containing protein [Rickettsiales bacterium]